MKDDACVIVAGETRMIMTGIPGRKGKYLVIESGGELMIVARVFGVGEERQELSARRLMAWAEGRTIT